MSSPSHLRAALRLIARGVRERGRPPAGPVAISPRRRPAVERAAIEIDPARVERYRRLTGGAAAAKGDVVPPVFSSTWETALALELLAEGELPLPTRGLVHVASELVVLRALRTGDRVRCRVELDRAEPHPSGAKVTLRSRNWNAAGQLCQENSLTFLLRFPGGSRDGRRPEREGEGMGSAVEWRPLAQWSLPASLGRRYARVSGDFNPIHLWGWSSRLLGFDRPIAHGFCTGAMIASALSEHLWRSDPAALRRLFVRFRAPLLLPARVVLEIGGELERGSGRFQLVGPAPESRTFAEGEFLGG